MRNAAICSSAIRLSLPTELVLIVASYYTSVALDFNNWDDIADWKFDDAIAMVCGGSANSVVLGHVLLQSMILRCHPEWAHPERFTMSIGVDPLAGWRFQGTGRGGRPRTRPQERPQERICESDLELVLHSDPSLEWFRQTATVVNTEEEFAAWETKQEERAEEYHRIVAAGERELRRGRITARITDASCRPFAEWTSKVARDMSQLWVHIGSSMRVHIGSSMPWLDRFIPQHKHYITSVVTIVQDPREINPRVRSGFRWLILNVDELDTRSTRRLTLIFPIRKSLDVDAMISAVHQLNCERGVSGRPSSYWLVISLVSFETFVIKRDA